MLINNPSGFLSESKQLYMRDASGCVLLIVGGDARLQTRRTQHHVTHFAHWPSRMAARWINIMLFAGPQKRRALHTTLT
jgi:hypothetical protein